jgi:hypothetical protein
MIIDVEAFGKDAASLGVDLETCEAYKALHETVQVPIPEGELLHATEVTDSFE